MTVHRPRARRSRRARWSRRGCRPLYIGGRMVHQISMPWHWGSYASSEQGVTGDAANDLVRALRRSRTCRSRSPRRSRATCARGGARRAERAAAGVHADTRVEPARTTRRRSDAPADHAGASRLARRTRPSEHARRTEVAIQAPGAAADGLLHRHDGVHRLQGLRGGLQAVERPAGRRPRVRARASSYDHTGSLSGSTWRHVRFVETVTATPAAERADRTPMEAAARTGRRGRPGRRCSRAADARPLGLHVRRVQALHERGLPRRLPHGRAHPHGVRDRGRCSRTSATAAATACRRARSAWCDRDHYDGRAAKCTLCYDRLEDGLEPACAKSCPTDSIQFGPYDELVEIARRRVPSCTSAGVERAYLYGAGDERRSAGGRARRVLPADRAARALRRCPRRPTRRSRRTCPGHRRGDGRRAAHRGGGRRGVRLASRQHRRRPLVSGDFEPARRAAAKARPTARAGALRASRERGRPSERDMTPAVGTHGEPGRWAARREGATVALHSGGGRTAAGRTSTAPTRPTRAPGATRATRRAAARAQRALDDAPTWPSGADDERGRSGPGRSRSTSGSAGWRRARRSWRSRATSRATTAPRGRARGRAGRGDARRRRC